MKTLFITTGGTIACTLTEAGWSPTLKGVDLISYFPHLINSIDIYDFELVDSSVMTDLQRQELAALLWEKRDDYNNFIITHGTDSMAFTAAYLSCALQNFPKSVILTGSQLSIVEDNNDAYDNLALALEIAQKDAFYGICLAFGGRILPAYSVTKFETEGFLGFDTNARIYLEKPLELPRKEPSYRTIQNNKVAIIYVTPQFPKELFLAYRDMYAVIVLSLGAGGMPKQYEERLEILQEKHNVKVYIKSQCIYGKIEKRYASHEAVNKFIPILEESIEYALYKIMFEAI